MGKTHSGLLEEEEIKYSDKDVGNNGHLSDSKSKHGDSKSVGNNENGVDEEVAAAISSKVAASDKVEPLVMLLPLTKLKPLMPFLCQSYHPLLLLQLLHQQNTGHPHPLQVFFLGLPQKRHQVRRQRAHCTKIVSMLQLQSQCNSSVILLKVRDHLEMI